MIIYGKQLNYKIVPNNNKPINTTLTVNRGTSLSQSNKQFLLLLGYKLK